MIEVKSSFCDCTGSIGSLSQTTASTLSSFS